MFEGGGTLVKYQVSSMQQGGSETTHARTAAMHTGSNLRMGGDSLRTYGNRRACFQSCRTLIKGTP